MSTNSKLSDVVAQTMMAVEATKRSGWQARLIACLAALGIITTGYEGYHMLKGSPVTGPAAAQGAEPAATKDALGHDIHKAEFTCTGGITTQKGLVLLNEGDFRNGGMTYVLNPGVAPGITPEVAKGKTFIAEYTDSVYKGKPQRTVTKLSVK
jgi:hypothetical protein